jgi:hypothetical protein
LHQSKVSANAIYAEHFAKYLRLDVVEAALQAFGDIQDTPLTKKQRGISGK